MARMSLSVILPKFGHGITCNILREWRTRVYGVLLPYLEVSATGTESAEQWGLLRISHAAGLDQVSIKFRLGDDKLMVSSWLDRDQILVKCRSIDGKI